MIQMILQCLQRVLHGFGKMYCKVHDDRAHAFRIVRITARPGNNVETLLNCSFMTIIDYTYLSLCGYYKKRYELNRAPAYRKSLSNSEVQGRL